MTSSDSGSNCHGCLSQGQSTMVRARIRPSKCLSIPVFMARYVRDCFWVGEIPLVTSVGGLFGVLTRGATRLYISAYWGGAAEQRGLDFD